MTDFNDKLALVFGGGRDIGGAISIALAQCGAQVALSYNSSDPAKPAKTVIPAASTLPANHFTKRLMEIT